MLKSLNVTGFRNLSSLSMEGLTRVNLLVGENNAGKTSVLEAIEILLLARTVPSALANGPMRRGENVPPRLDDEQSSGAEIDLEQLFHCRDASPRSVIKLRGDTSEGALALSCTVATTDSVNDTAALLARVSLTELDASSSAYVVMTAEPGAHADRIPLVVSKSELVRRGRRSLSADARLESPILHFVGTAAPRTDALGSLWDGVVLTPEENKVTEALQIIQPDIERLAWLSHSRPGAGGMFVKLQGSDRRFPLGSMGEGIKRLLVLAMSLVKSAGGYLLVDEIDTGLHYSVMVKMWKLVVETARRLNLQVFATSHSLDCIQALAGLYESEPDVRDDISLHRIEKGAEVSIRYSADEILSAARRQVEVR